jgi:RNA polymerase primary sigma factor
MGDEETGRREQAAHAEGLLATLTRREQKVLRMRYGMGQEPEHTLKEIGEQLEVSRERVRQIEEEALEKLRARLRRRALAPANNVSPGRRREAS